MISQLHYDNIKSLLDRWADQAQGGRIADGAPQASPGAPDSRIHSIEDWELADNKRIVAIMDAAIYRDLIVLERNAIMMHYGIMSVPVWRAEFTSLFDQAIESLFELLKKKVSC